MASHIAIVLHLPGRRYPYLPHCTCGQEFWGYMTRTAAQNIADDHNATAGHK